METALASCTLRDWRIGDEASLVRHADNWNVAQNVADVFPHPYTMDDGVAWVRKQAGEVPQTQFAIDVDGAAVGGIGLRIGSDIHRRSAEVGYWLGEAFWGRGIITDALVAVTRYAFETFDLAHVFAGIFERNVASRRVFEKNRFTLEGTIRRAARKRGRFVDEWLFGLVPEDLA